MTNEEWSKIVAAHKKQHAARARQYRDKNREKCLEAARKYRAKNREKLNAAARARRLQNLDKFRAEGRKRSAKWLKKGNRKKASRQSKNWIRANPGRYKEYLRRSNIIRTYGGSADLYELFQKQKILTKELKNEGKK